MPDIIGRITVPDIILVGTFPLVTDFVHGRAQKRNVVEHLFGDASGKVTQRFYVGPAATRYTFQRAGINFNQRQALAAFWDSQLGGAGAFIYNVPQEDQSFVATAVRFEDQPLSLDSLADCIVRPGGITFVEIPDPSNTPNYFVIEILTRFPDSMLLDALLDQVQEIIPLVRIRVLDTNVPDIYLSDRRANVDGNLYLPRILGIGDPGSGVLITQTIEGGSDDTQFTFGNADRIMTQLANDTELKKARIELSLYHVQTQAKLDLWAGEIVDWTSDKSAEFQVQASDIITALTLQSPVGSISRTCWKIVGDSNYGCPAAPGSTCDLGYFTPDGCLAKGGTVNLSYGGQDVKPQAVTIKDNSTGTIGGFGRALITPTSQIDDTIYGGTLSEIWHNDDGIPQRGLSVDCRMVDGRDESDFYDGLGIVGRGPIGAYTVARMYDSDGDGKAETFIGSTLDGQPHHGFKQTNSSGAFTDSGFGLRQVPGTDPASPGDFFSLGRVAGTPGPNEVLSAGEIFLNTFAAGVAFMEIRRTDQKGIQPSEVKSHRMVAMISQGLTGFTWSGPGSRSSAPGLTNPFWVAINSLIRSLGLARPAITAATQELYFDPTAGAQCGAIADTVVPALFGGGTELQFRFKGVISDLKPLRDQLTAILNNALGFYTFAFGRLKLGCRNNAVPRSIFSAGNILMGSLRLSPIKPKFEKLTVSFADEEYLFDKNTADYCDQDYALRNNRVQNPLTSQIGLIGSATKSQAGRIAVIRTREELGGVGVTEQTNAREATWKSSILALDTEAGQVVGIQDVDIPNGSGNFRIQKYSLNRDYSIDFFGKTVTDSMYDLTQGTTAVDIAVVKQPTQADIDTGPPPEPWFLGQVAPDNTMAAEVYDLHFLTEVNTRTIIHGTFTFWYDDPTDLTHTTLKKTVSTNFPYDFFLVVPPAVFSTSFPYGYQQAALDWVLKCALPGMHVSQIDGFVTNVYGDSPVHTIMVNLQLAGLPKSTTTSVNQYLESYDATTSTFTLGHFDDGETPTGTMNGSNRVFTLLNTPNNPASLKVEINGDLLATPVDYVLSGTTITLDPATYIPNAAHGDVLRVFYTY